MKRNNLACELSIKVLLINWFDINKANKKAEIHRKDRLISIFFDIVVCERLSIFIQYLLSF